MVNWAGVIIGIVFMGTLALVVYMIYQKKKNNIAVPIPEPPKYTRTLEEKMPRQKSEKELILERLTQIEEEEKQIEEPLEEPLIDFKDFKRTKTTEFFFNEAGLLCKRKR